MGKKKKSTVRFAVDVVSDTCVWGVGWDHVETRVLESTRQTSLKFKVWTDKNEEKNIFFCLGAYVFHCVSACVPTSAIVFQCIALKDTTDPFPSFVPFYFKVGLPFVWSFHCDTDGSSRGKGSPPAVLLAQWTRTGMCLFGICSTAPKLGESRGQGSMRGLLHPHCTSALQAFVSLEGWDGHGNYAKAMHTLTKQSITLFLTIPIRPLNCPYFQSQLDIILPELLKR